MFSGTNLSDMLRALSASLETPVVFLLLLAAAITVVMLGTVIAETFTERIRMRAKMPSVVEAVRDMDADIEKTIENSGLLKRQRGMLTELTRHPDLTPVMREALARRLIFEEQQHYDRITRVTDLLAKVAPMLGLLGTLIPLGPGLIALGQGDTYTLSTSLLTAFDTTVAGLAVAAVAFLISSVRKTWYENYMTASESIAECILEREAKRGERT